MWPPVIVTPWMTIVGVPELPRLNTCVVPPPLIAVVRAPAPEIVRLLLKASGLATTYATALAGTLTVSPAPAELMAWRSEQLPPNGHVPPMSSVRVTVHVLGTAAEAGTAQTNAATSAARRRDMTRWWRPAAAASVSGWSQ